MPAQQQLQKQNVKIQKKPLSLQEWADKWFENGWFWEPFGSRWMADVFPRMPELTLPTLELPTVDMSETDTAIVVEANVPGYDPKTVDVEVGEGYLTISGEMEEEKEEKKKKYHRKERSSGSFRRHIPLPSYADEEKVTCKAKNGTLKITIQKKPEAVKKTRKVAIES